MLHPGITMPRPDWLEVLEAHSPQHQSDWVQVAVLSKFAPYGGCVQLDASMLCTTTTALTQLMKANTESNVMAFQPPWNEEMYEGRPAALETWALGVGSDPECIKLVTAYLKELTHHMSVDVKAENGGQSSIEGTAKRLTEEQRLCVHPQMRGQTYLAPMLVLQYTWRLLVPKAKITFEPSTARAMPLSWLPEGAMKTCLRTSAPTDVVASREVRMATLLLDSTSIKDEAAFLKQFHVPLLIKLCGHDRATIQRHRLLDVRVTRRGSPSRQSAAACSTAARCPR